jgi:hypothetical protein
MLGAGVGPAQERLAPAQRTDPDRFSETVGALAEGVSSFPAPFDLITAAVLAGNTITGDAAVDSYTAVHQATDRQYHIQVHEVVHPGVPGQPTPLRREVLDVVLPSTVAAALLIEVASQIDED